MTNEKTYSFEPEIITRNLFTISDIAKSAEANTVDLAFDDQGRPRALSVDTDDQAKRLALRLVATSRFEDYFTENLSTPTQPDDDVIDIKATPLGELGFSDTENASHDSLSEALRSHNCPGIEREKQGNRF